MKLQQLKREEPWVAEVFEDWLNDHHVDHHLSPVDPANVNLVIRKLFKNIPDDAKLMKVKDRNGVKNEKYLLWKDVEGPIAWWNFDENPVSIISWPFTFYLAKA